MKQKFTNQTRDTQPIRWDTIYPAENPRLVEHRSSSKYISCMLVLLILVSAILFCPIIGFVIMPMRINVLFLGIDFAPNKSFSGRSDTIMLSTFLPLEPYVGIVSIPRDLWIEIPGIGTNRINTAHYFAEISEPGSGPQATINTIENNFDVNVQYYLRVRFDGVKEIVDALGGVNIYLPEPMAGYPAGFHHLSGNKALAFARNRSSSDDFGRMAQGQLLIKSIVKQILLPKHLPQLPGVVLSISRSIETNVPLWQFHRMILTILRVGIDNIDSRVINREMITPYTTQEGAMVLLPNWDLINPIIQEMFHQ
jgi:LCP family protein required for cell wall assembly